MSVRGYLMPRRRWFPLDGRMHRFWLSWLEAPVLWRFPWVWRPMCWLDGGHKPYYGRCTGCGLNLGADS